MSVEPQAQRANFKPETTIAVLNRAGLKLHELPVTFKILEVPSFTALYGGPYGKPRRFVQAWCESPDGCDGQKDVARHISAISSGLVIHGDLSIVPSKFIRVVLSLGARRLLDPAEGLLTVGACYSDLMQRIRELLCCLEQHENYMVPADVLVSGFRLSITSTRWSARGWDGV